MKTSIGFGRPLQLSDEMAKFAEHLKPDNIAVFAFKDGVLVAAVCETVRQSNGELRMNFISGKLEFKFRWVVATPNEEMNHAS